MNGNRVQLAALCSNLQAFVVFLFVVCSFETAQAGAGVVTSEMAGEWRGNARIIMNWCQETNLPLAMTIRADGTVTGQIGDAILTNAFLRLNRGAVAKKLNLKTDYIIVGQLNGPIVAKENIVRRSVSIPLNFNNGMFAGGLHTSGSMFGGKEKMILSASGVKLIRVEKR
jgi:hypothetical protein